LPNLEIYELGSVIFLKYCYAPFPKIGGKLIVKIQKNMRLRAISFDKAFSSYQLH
jgi:hypothetical protein